MKAKSVIKRFLAIAAVLLVSECLQWNALAADVSENAHLTQEDSPILSIPQRTVSYLYVGKSNIFTSSEVALGQERYFTQRLKNTDVIKTAERAALVADAILSSMFGRSEGEEAANASPLNLWEDKKNKAWIISREGGFETIDESTDVPVEDHVVIQQTDARVLAIWTTRKNGLMRHPEEPQIAEPLLIQQRGNAVGSIWREDKNSWEWLGGTVFDPVLINSKKPNPEFSEPKSVIVAPTSEVSYRNCGSANYKTYMNKFSQSKIKTMTKIATEENIIRTKHDAVILIDALFTAFHSDNDYNFNEYEGAYVVSIPPYLLYEDVENELWMIITMLPPMQVNVPYAGYNAIVIRKSDGQVQYLWETGS